jgi:hypothetical protein
LHKQKMLLHHNNNHERENLFSVLCWDLIFLVTLFKAVCAG